MKLLIVEDSKQQYELIKKTITYRYPEIDIFYADNYDNAVNYIRNNHFQILILDINLGEGKSKNGIALAKYIRSITGYAITPILFLTSIPTEIASAINDAHCYSYLIKPYTDDSLLSSLGSLMQSPLLPAEPLELKGVNGIYFRIKPEDIIYVEIFQHNLIIYTELNIFETKAYTITEFCSKLTNHLIQIHKSYAINPAYLNHSETNLIYVNFRGNSIALPMGRKYKEEVTRRL